MDHQHKSIPIISSREQKHQSPRDDQHAPIKYLNPCERKTPQPPTQHPAHPLYHRNNILIEKQRLRCSNGFYFAYCGLQSCGRSLYVFGAICEYNTFLREEYSEWLFISFIEIDDPIIISGIEKKVKELAKKNKEYSRHHTDVSTIITKDIDAYIQFASAECMRAVQSRSYTAAVATIPFSNFATNIDDLERVTRMTIDYKNAEIKSKLMRLIDTFEDADRVVEIIKDLKL